MNDEKIENEIENEELEDVKNEKLDDENGKWFRDIAKYVATAVVFASMFQDIENKAVSYSLAVGVTVVLYAVGTWYFTKNKRKKKKKNNKKKKINNNTKTN